jgi:hypothetical protein
VRAFHIEIVFRKSDVSWNGNSRGWEMMLSHSFKTNITSGYVKGTSSAGIELLMKRLRACAVPMSHPLLLPVLMLIQELSTKNDVRQRNARDQLRRLENALTGRYNPAVVGAAPAPGYGISSVGDELTLDAIKHDLVECRSQVLWKRPQAWQNAINRLARASDSYWDQLPDEFRELPGAGRLHRTLTSRLDFMTAKLEGLEHYAHVSLERLDIQREEVRGF